MNKNYFQEYRKELGWKQIILFCGFINVLNIGFWIVQLIVFNISFDNKFFNKRFLKVTYVFGWIIAITLLSIFLFGMLLD